jgi:hypothetical protein
MLSFRTANPDNPSPSKPLFDRGNRLAKDSQKRRLKMVGETNISQFRSWLTDAQPEDLVKIAPLLFNRIGTLDQTQQDRFIKEVQSDPQAKSVFEKMKSYTH